MTPREDRVNDTALEYSSSLAVRAAPSKKSSRWRRQLLSTYDSALRA